MGIMDVFIRSFQPKTKRLILYKAFDAVLVSPQFIEHRHEIKKKLKRNINKRKHRINDGVYSCMQCNASFSMKKLLKSHLMKHSEQRPFLCRICRKGFHQKEALRQHLDAHYGAL